MSVELKLATWNANGLCQHTQELITFIKTNNLDILLISETHFTKKSHINIPNYNIYTTNHPDGRAHGGSAIIINSKLKHYEVDKFSTEHIQATNVIVSTSNRDIVISALYCPPRHNNKKESFKHYFKTLGTKFIAGGDFNAKHIHWGSRLTTTKGRELLAAITDENIKYLTTGEPTYWPTDQTKSPDLIDFFLIKGLDEKSFKIESSFDLSSDHSPILLTYHAHVVHLDKSPHLSSTKTNWSLFREILLRKINLNIPLKSQNEIENAVEYLTKIIQKSAWKSTPDFVESERVYANPRHVQELIKEKRKMRKVWQKYRKSDDKIKLNRMTLNLKKELNRLKNESVQNYLSKLSPFQNTNYDLWKATKKLKQPKETQPPIKTLNGKWARNNQEKADTFANHLVNVFMPWDIENEPQHVQKVHQFLESPFQMDFPIKQFSIREVKSSLCNTKPKKSPGVDLITGKILQELPENGYKLITFIYNAILRERYFPSQWKVSEIIMIHKPGKNPEEVSSYRPISLLPILSKNLEKLLLKRLKPILDINKTIPDYQFGFRNNHSTIEQVHRIVNQINNCFEEKKYCSAVFIDISQAFDKVWHEGLLFKIKSNLPYQFYEIFKSYLENRTFYVRQQSAISNLQDVKSGVPQGSVLGPTLYLLYTADLPLNNDVMTATFADDTTIIASDSDRIKASTKLQSNITKIQEWLKIWKIKANETKSAHVTFTLKKDTCPPVYLNNNIIPQTEDVKYLGMHLDRRLTWKKHIWTKRKQLDIKLRSMYWLLGKKSELSLENKILVYKTILKPIWTYGLQLWGTSAKSNIEILQRFQNKTLRTITTAPWFVSNEILHNDLNIPLIQEEVQRFSQNYRTRINEHQNRLTRGLMNQRETRRLSRKDPADLSHPT